MEIIINQGITCTKCDRYFATPKDFTDHLLTCGRFICYQCNVPFIHPKALNYHIEHFHRRSPDKKKQYKCSLCNQICQSRKELYIHRMNQHGGDDNLNFIPPYIVHHENEELKQAYITNREHILAADDHGDIKKTYNFPSNNLHRGYREIRGQITQIYNDQNQSFRVNFAFGMILFNNGTGEYRYFVPHFNNKILSHPYTIINRNSINFFMHKITGIDIIEQARAVRPSTVWSLAFITNVQYVVFLTDFPLGNAIAISEYILTNGYIKSMYYNKHTGKPYTDNFCCFRCLKHHRGNIKKVKEYVDIWKKQRNIPKELPFPGIKIDDISKLEICFKVKIMVYCLNSNGTVSLLYNSLSNNTDIMYLNMYGNHFSYITNFEKLVKRFQCDKCLKLFKHQWNLKRHYSNCYYRTKYSFPGGFYCNSTTLFAKLKSLNIHVPLECQFYNKFIVWDMEAILLKSNINKSEKLTLISQHHPISVSIASNVENFQTPECFVVTEPDQLIEQMMTYISEISLYNKEIMMEKYYEVYFQLNELISKYNDNSDSNKSKHDTKIKSHFFNSLNNIKKELDRYISQIPVIGFNSGKYDLNLIKKYIISYIVENYEEQDIHTIKKEYSYLSISTLDMKFIDISNYLAAGSSYSQFLKAYGCDEPKGIFPYEWFDSFEKLKYPKLPEPEDFYSKTKKDNPIKTEADNKKLQRIWKDKAMTTFQDYLIYYNNLDTGPFVIALENLLKVYFDDSIDIFKDYVTLPGVARRMLYNSSNSKFSLFNSENANLYYTFKQNIVGGPSIIFLVIKKRVLRILKIFLIINVNL